MPVSMQSLGIDRLPAEDRIRLAEEIWESLSDELNAESLSPSLKAELERRVAADDANPDEGFRWEDVQARLRRPQSRADFSSSSPRRRPISSKPSIG